MSKDSQHDVKDTTNKRTGGEVPHPPDPSNIEQGTKPSEVRDAGDHATNPKPSK